MKNIILFIIKFYRIVLASLFPKVCRFVPSCSEYALQAIEKRGIVRGCFLSLKRICRCHPWKPCGYDPVP